MFINTFLWSINFNAAISKHRDRHPLLLNAINETLIRLTNKTTFVWWDGSNQAPIWRYFFIAFPSYRIPWNPWKQYSAWPGAWFNGWRLLIMLAQQIRILNMSYMNIWLTQQMISSQRHTTVSTYRNVQNIDPKQWLGFEPGICVVDDELILGGLVPRFDKSVLHVT